MKKQLCFLFLTLGILRALADAQALQNVNGLTSYGAAAGADLTNNNANAFVIFTNNQVSLSVNSSGIFTLTNYAGAGLGCLLTTNGAIQSATLVTTSDETIGGILVVNGSNGKIRLANAAFQIDNNAGTGIRLLGNNGNILLNALGSPITLTAGTTISFSGLNASLSTSGNFVVTNTVIATNGFSSYTNFLAVNSFTFPSTTVNWTNPVHVSIEVYIDNTAVTGTIFKKNGTQIFGGLSTDLTIGLRDGEYFSETYTIGTPSGTWSVFP